ncbi:Holliday junction resolvase [Candidatus Woesearchaeota archaeon]|nr:Holliday junction resolvase [Candidatus Woesearchaeota archaeon]
MGLSFSGRKAKGSKAERELIHLLWENGFAAMRAAGSGSTKHPSPDIVAGNGHLFFAIECKASHKLTKYLDKDEISQLDLFANSFGARAIVAIRFDNEQWYFITIPDLKETPKGFAVNYELAKKKALTFEELIGKYRQKRLT